MVSKYTYSCEYTTHRLQIVDDFESNNRDANDCVKNHKQSENRQQWLPLGRQKIKWTSVFFVKEFHNSIMAPQLKRVSKARL